MTFYCPLCSYKMKKPTDRCPEHPEQKPLDEKRWKEMQEAITRNIGDDKRLMELMEILENPQLFFRITVDELDKKIVGEIETRQTIFLCACGAFVANNNPASYNCLVNSLSGAGKDWTAHKTLSIFPKESYIKRTRISEKVFTYWHNPKFEPEWTWDGKIFYNEDINPKVLNSEVFKVMCSSGSHATVLINQRSVDIEIKGKPVIIVTTARAVPDKEVVRRFSLVNCDESQDQTKQIVKRQAKYAETGRTMEYDRDITEALGKLKQVCVKVPFAGQISQAIPTDNIIVRTAFQRLIDFIKASTALHQLQRKQDEEEYYIATLQDYQIAQIAFRKTTCNQYLIPLTHEQKKLLDIIRQLQKDKLRQLEEGNDQPPQQRLDSKAVNVDQGLTYNEIEPLIHFWEERHLRNQLNILAEYGILATGKRKEEGAKRPSKTYLLPEINEEIKLPDLELQNSATNAIDATNAIHAINATNHNPTAKNKKKKPKSNNCINCTPVSGSKVQQKAEEADKS